MSGRLIAFIEKPSTKPKCVQFENEIAENVYSQVDLDLLLLTLKLFLGSALLCSSVYVFFESVLVYGGIVRGVNLPLGDSVTVDYVGLKSISKMNSTRAHSNHL